MNQEKPETPDFSNLDVEMYGDMADNASCQDGAYYVYEKYVKPLRDENERLRTTLVAGAELIKENWSKLCDEEGYGPQNLLLRMDGTLNTSGYPGYRAGEFERLQQEVETLKKQYNDLGVKFDKEMERLHERDEDMRSERDSLREQLDKAKSEAKKWHDELSNVQKGDIEIMEEQFNKIGARDLLISDLREQNEKKSEAIEALLKELIYQSTTGQWWFWARSNEAVPDRILALQELINRK